MVDRSGTTSYADVEKALLGRWPETRIEPTLDRVRAVLDLMGDPHLAYPVVHLTGTNGKTTTARMVEALLRSLDLRTGRFTSPHLESMTERIAVDGAPLSQERFVEVYAEVAPYLELVDARSDHPLSFFEAITAMAFAAFADAPVDAAVVEVGLGGTWDATNVVRPVVCVITPVAVDHAHLLGNTPVEVASEKAGIIKPGSLAVLAQQEVEVAQLLLHRAVEVGASVAREGIEFGVASRTQAVGGQLVTVAGLHATYDEIFLPLYGAHQAGNAACALAAVEAFAGGQSRGQGLDVELVRRAFAELTSPGRLEVVRRSPTILVDAAHNPHGVRATAASITEDFRLAPLVGVLGVMADKDVTGILDALEPVLAGVVCTQNTTERALPAAELGEAAVEVFGADRVEVVPRLDDALDRAVAWVEGAGDAEVGLGSGGVLVTGSVVTAGEARTLLRGRD